MSIVEFRAGESAILADGTVWSDDMFGYRYTGFRGFGRFMDQMADKHVGIITWPGGYLAEFDTARFGLGIDGLFDQRGGRPGLADMFEIANADGAGLAVMLPTVRYLGNDDALRADIRGFMGDLLSGHYGAPPSQLIFEIGSEFYVSFYNGQDAAEYGHIANIYVEELSAALNDPQINLIGLDVQIAVQCGRNVAEDEIIRDQMTDESVVEVDQVIYHRFAFNATGVDNSADAFGDVLDAWRLEAAQLGGTGPSLFFSAYNVGSYTRDEALRDFLAADHNAGGHLTAADVDLGGRTTDEFEQFWQDQLTKRDYGGEHPRLLLEMLSEFHGEGMTAASSFGTDMIHPGRLSLTDVNGVAQDFVGQDLLDMMAESVIGTKSLAVNLTNDRGDEIWTYGFENDDKLVVFLSTDNTPPGSVTLRLAGLGSVYRQVSAEGLTASVPEDWMTRFGIIDNPNIDESPEGTSFAVGERTALTPRFADGELTVDVSAPNEVIRLSFAKTEAGALDIAGFSDAPVLDLAEGWVDADAADAPGMMMFAAPTDLPMVPMDEEAAALPEDTPDGQDGGGGDGGGGFLLALMPLLFLLGGF
jgi:hypothetical protein